VLIWLSDAGAVVTFLVGPGDAPKKFIVQKEFACYYSPVLRAAFNSEFIEGQTQTYRLEETTEGTFRFLMQWLYTQRLELVQLRKEEVPIDDAYIEDGNLFGLWVLADNLGMEKLQNQAIKSIEEVGIKTKSHATTHIRYIYENTAASSPLRRFMVDRCSSFLDVKEFANWPKNYYPYEFLMDMIGSMKPRLNGNAPEMDEYLVKVRDDQ